MSKLNATNDLLNKYDTWRNDAKHRMDKLSGCTRKNYPDTYEGKLQQLIDWGPCGASDVLQNRLIFKLAERVEKLEEKLQ